MGWGFLGKIWEGVKNVFGGIGKVFAGVLAALNLDTGWGKALMLAVSVFTFGAALMAGGSAFMGGLTAQGGGFVQAFVEGGKAFMGSLLGTGAKDTGVVDAMGAGEAVNEGALLAGAEASTMNPLGANMGPAAGEAAKVPLSGTALGDTTGVLEGMAGGAASEIGAAGNLSKAASAAGQPAAAAATEAGGSWLSKAAGKAWDFAKSDDGQNIIGSALDSYEKQQSQKAWQDHQARVLHRE